MPPAAQAAASGKPILLCMRERGAEEEGVSLMVVVLFLFWRVRGLTSIEVSQTFAKFARGLLHAPRLRGTRVRSMSVDARQSKRRRRFRTNEGDGQSDEDRTTLGLLLKHEANPGHERVPPRGCQVGSVVERKLDCQARRPDRQDDGANQLDRLRIKHGHGTFERRSDTSQSRRDARGQNVRQQASRSAIASRSRPQ